MSQLEVIIRARRTAYDFASEPLEPDMLRSLCDVAVCAPNHRRTAPWRFVVLGQQSRATLTRLAADQAGGGAEARAKAALKWEKIGAVMALFSVSTKPDDVEVVREDYAACACAAQNLLLLLWERGLAAQWCTGKVTRLPELRQLIGCGERDTFVGLFRIGVPLEVPELPNRPHDPNLVRDLP